MLHARTLSEGPLSVVDYVCTARPSDRPYVEQHRAWSVSYVLHGSFGCRCRGANHELVAGSVLIGRPGDDFQCNHDHHAGGDRCLAFYVAPELQDEICAGRSEAWISGALPPLAELVALGELARASASGASALAIDEIGVAFAARFVDIAAGRRRRRAAPRPQDRRRALDAARWIEAQAGEAIDLAQAARRAGLSAYHFLRVFSAVLGVTPHQYLIRSRLRHAAAALADGDRSITEIGLDAGFADLSNFVRTFHRAAGASPRAYRRAARGDRKIFQERLATSA